MKAIAHNALRAHAVIAVLSIAILASLAAIAVAAPKKQTIAVARNIDGIVIRGTWRAQVGIGTPAVTIVADEAVLRTLRIGRNARSLTIAQSIRPKGNNKAEIRVTLARLRGIATSDSVELTLHDRSDAPLFLDLSGTGSARAMGSVPLLRVTTSGSVDADLTGMTASRARVHARQTSRLAVRAQGALTIVAVDAARVVYRGTTRAATTRRNEATVTHL